MPLAQRGEARFGVVRQEGSEHQLDGVEACLGHIGKDLVEYGVMSRPG